MKRIRLIGYFHEGNCLYERSEDEAFLVTSDIAAVAEGRAIGFFRVKPSGEGDDSYEDCGYLFEIRMPARSIKEIGNMPPETAAFAEWVKERL